jgi:hypothetical protein
MKMPRQGKSLTMLREASRYADYHPAASVLVVAHTQEFCGYLRDLANVERLSPRLTFVPVNRAGDVARGRRGEFFVDHAVWENHGSLVRLALALDPAPIQTPVSLDHGVPGDPAPPPLIGHETASEAGDSLFDRLMAKLEVANRRAEEDLQFLRGIHAEILGVPVEQLDQHMAAQKAEEDRLRQEARAAAPARAPKGKAAKGGDAIGIGRAALSDRQRELLSHVEVENNLAVYKSAERVPDWDLLKRIMLALGGTWKTGGKKAPGGFRFPDDLDAAELVRLAKETGEITDPKAAQYFWTSDELADELAAFVAPVASGRYLEPSAGKGALAQALKRQCAELPGHAIDCIEPLDENRKALLASGFSLIGHDFLVVDPLRLWDGCILNPPFSGQADCRHILKAIECVRPGGRVAAIASAGVQYRQNKLTQQFREELARHGAEVIANPEGSFAHADTLVRTVRILLTKVAT